MRLKFLLFLIYSTFTLAQKQDEFCKEGIKKAQFDFSNGFYILQTLGQEADKDFHPFLIKYADENFKIRLTHSSDVLFAHTECYDSTMRKSVLTKFGDTIEDKIRTEALLEFKQSELYKNKIQPKIDTGFVFSWSHRPPEFPGGASSMKEFIKNNIREIKNHSYWSTSISVVIEKDGSLSNISFYNDPKKAVKQEVIRLIELMPKWIPAQYYRENVRYKLFITLSSKKEMEMMDEIKRKKTRPN